VTVGIEDGNFSRFVSDLSPNTTYYYTALATNSIGSSWAAPSESFTTPDALPLRSLSTKSIMIPATKRVRKNSLKSTTQGLRPSISQGG